MQLTDRDSAMLEGEFGETAALAMDLTMAVGDALGAPRMIDIVAAHIDGCLYHGDAGLDFAQRLVEGGGVVAVPTTLNVTSLDLLHPDLYRGSEKTAASARALMTEYERLGCEPTWTCAPYQLASRPSLGDQVAWGESNAIVFANSVLGARTNRYGDFLDICCAVTGRAPFVGLHTDEGRQATLVIEVAVPDSALDGDLVYVLIGHTLGRLARAEVAVIDGLDERATEDRLKAIGAAAASSGAVGMFHVNGVTPEAATLHEATGGVAPTRVMRVTTDDLRNALGELSTGTGLLGAVSVGTPHMSLEEMRELKRLTEGRRTSLPFYLNTSRSVLGRADLEGVGESLREFGATIVTDTCTYITPVMAPIEGDVMTNSGKWAFYAPANLGVGVEVGSLVDCVESAIAGRLTRTDGWLKA